MSEEKSRVAGLEAEVATLRARVEELEGALRAQEEAAAQARDSRAAAARREREPGLDPSSVEDAASLNEARLEALLRLNQMVGAPLSEIASFAMEEAVRLTRSAVGYIAFASEDESVLSMHAWSRSAMAMCEVADKPFEYPVVTTGLWGEAVRQRRPIITNDYAAPSPWKKGLPEGHVTLRRHMNVPVFDGDRIVIVAGVGNKATDYDESDVRQLTLLMTEMWRIVRRRQAEHELQKRTQELDRFFSVALDLLCIADTNGHFHRLNPEWERTLGYPLEELEGRRFLDLVHPEDVEATLGAMRELAAQHEVLNFVNRYRCKDGTYRFLEWRSTPVGELVFAAARDVTEHRRIEEALTRSRQMLQAVLDHFPGVVFWKDRESVYLGCNRAFALGAGLSDASEIAGKTDYDLPWASTEADKYRADDREVVASGRPKLGIIEPQHRVDGRVTWFNTSKVPLIGADGAVFGVLGTAADITEMRRLEEQYRQAQKMEAVGALAGGVAHDFNNLLQIVTGYLELAQLKLATAEVPTHELQEIGKATTRASALVRQLLAFSRRQTMQREHVDVGALVAGLAKMLRRIIEERIELRTACRGPLPTVFADPGHLEQVVVNLCVNARDAMPDGGVLRIETRCESLGEDAGSRGPDARPGEYVVISVSDTGCGIPEENLDRIFEPFFTTKGIGKGTGLGLAMVYGIVKQHEGFVEVRSEVGRGTEVQVFLPAAPQPEAAPHDGDPCLPLLLGGNETILLAEDEAPVRELAARVLREAGYRVLVAADGEEALELAASSGDAVALYVLDAVLPKLSGRAVRDAIVARRPDARILFCTGHSAEALGESLESPASELLRKPFSCQALLRRVRELLG